MKRKIELCLVLLLLVGAMIASKKLSEITAKVAKEGAETVIVVDPGHGGRDPGKVGLNDVLEKDLNLQVAKKVKKKLKKQGIKVVMTREDDEVPDSKREDLEQRINLINDTKPVLALCIHQNSFPDASVHGAQVFYYESDKTAKQAATDVQEKLKEIDPDNSREIKANGQYYMLTKSKVTTIIVECGFLTNPEESARLTEEEYQEQLSDAICEGVIKWLDKTKK